MLQISMAEQTPFIEDDAKEKASMLIEHRLPWLIVGLVGGILATVVSAQFEDLLAKNIQLAFFIPVIVYMADAVGTQTQTVYIRNLGKHRELFHKYIFKEMLLGIVIGSLFGCIMALVSYIWFGSLESSMTVGLSMLITIATAPIIALIVPTIIRREHKDPAVGSGPFTTVIQDLISLLVYFSIASVIIL
ncbi:MAG: magnesium transporter [Candidatus Levybacteria bacterium]|nr:magnesium transporter [Candidatus Levybacteria bacterium]